MVKKIDNIIFKDNNIIGIFLEEVMLENYLLYVIEVVKERVFFDVRDGLKFVYRRILYGVYMFKVFLDRLYYKFVRIVGDILGKYYFYGDLLVYEFMVILV